MLLFRQSIKACLAGTSVGSVHKDMYISSTCTRRVYNGRGRGGLRAASAPSVMFMQNSTPSSLLFQRGLMPRGPPEMTPTRDVNNTCTIRDCSTNFNDGMCRARVVNKTVVRSRSIVHCSQPVYHKPFRCTFLYCNVDGLSTDNYQTLVQLAKDRVLDIMIVLEHKKTLQSRCRRCGWVPEVGNH